MLLRRFTEHVRDQNWFAVFLDLGIVILGVVVGLQVSNWNNAREDISAERIYLERIYADLQQSIEDLNRDIEGIGLWRANSRQTLAALMANDPDSVSEFGGFELQASTRINLGGVQMATVRELISGGHLNLIRDPEVRAGIARLDAQISSLSDYNRLLAANMAQIAPLIHTRLRPVIQDEGLSTVTYDFAAITSDQEFQNALGFTFRIQTVNEFWLGSMLQEVEQLRDQLTPLVAEVDNE